MAATYDITTHALLSAQAQVLYQQDPDAFDALAEQSERMLNVHETAFTGADLGAVKFAVVRQMNFILHITPESQIAAMVVRGSRTTTYKAGSPPTLDSIARQTVVALGVSVGDSTTSAYPIVRGLR